MTFDNPGELRHEATVQKMVVTPNDNGTVTRTWADLSPNPIRVKIEQLAGRELTEAQAQNAKATRRVSGYHFAGLEPQHYRFKLAGPRYLNILHVLDEDEMAFKFTALCGEDV